MPTPGTTKDELKRTVFAAIERRAEEIVGLGERIRKTARDGLQGGEDRAAWSRRRSAASAWRRGPGWR